MALRTRFACRWIVIVVGMLVFSAVPAFGQAPAGPTVLWQFRTPGLPQPQPFSLVHSRVHFAPGAATPFHRHPGQVVVTVLEGENTFTMNGVTRVYRAGESFVEQPNEPNQARNAGATPMSVMATYLLPAGAQLSQPEAGDTTPPPRPTTSYQFQTDVAAMPEPFDVVQQGLEFAPGAATPRHTHPGLVMVTVLAGELTFAYGDTTTVYREGESFIEERGVLAQARNASTAPTRVMATYVLPAGAPLSNPLADPGALPASLPSTGAGRAADHVWLLAMIGAGLLIGGMRLRRRPAQTR